MNEPTASHAQLAILAQLERQTELLEQLLEHFTAEGGESVDVTDHSSPPGLTPTYIAFPVKRQSDGKPLIRRQDTQTRVSLSAPVREVRSYSPEGEDKYRPGPIANQLLVPNDHTKIWAEVEATPGNWVRVTDPLDIEAELGE